MPSVGLRPSLPWRREHTESPDREGLEGRVLLSRPIPSTASSPSTAVEHPMENRLVLGRKGSGKTSLTRSLAPRWTRALLVDPFGEYADLCDAKVRTVPDLRDYLATTDGAWRVSYTTRNVREDFPVLCRCCMALGDCMLVVEETSQHCSAWRIGQEFLELVEYGRHALEEETGTAHPVGLVAMSRTPTEIHNIIRSQSWEMDCFALSEPAHLEWCAKVVSPEFALRVRDLDDSHYLSQNLVGARRPFEERVTDPAFRSRGYDGNRPTSGMSGAVV